MHDKHPDTKPDQISESQAPMSKSRRSIYKLDKIVTSTKVLLTSRARFAILTNSLHKLSDRQLVIDAIKHDLEAA